MMRVFLRATRFVLHLVSGLLTELWLVLRYGNGWYLQPRGKKIIQRWMRKLCTILDIQVVLRGQASCQNGTLFVTNHISWLDVVGLSSIVESRFIAKSSVRAWPVVGTLAAASGTMFISRNRRSALKLAINTLNQAIREQTNVVIFPEGTTTSGDSVSEFHNGLFQVAIETGCPVQGMSLRYYRNGEIDRIAPFIGDDSFIAHLFRVFSQPGLKLEIRFGDVNLPPFAERRVLSREIKKSVEALLSQSQCEDEKQLDDLPGYTDANSEMNLRF